MLLCWLLNVLISGICCASITLVVLIYNYKHSIYHQNIKFKLLTYENSHQFSNIKSWSWLPISSLYLSIPYIIILFIMAHHCLLWFYMFWVMGPTLSVYRKITCSCLLPFILVYFGIHGISIQCMYPSQVMLSRSPSLHHKIQNHTMQLLLTINL